MMSVMPSFIWRQTGLLSVVSRRDFRRATVAYAAALKKMGIAPRDLVVIAHTQDLESIYAFWGALLAGAIPSMFPTLTEKLDAGIYTQSMAELVKLSGVRAILTTDAFAPELGAHVDMPGVRLGTVVRFDLRRRRGDLCAAHT